MTYNVPLLRKVRDHIATRPWEWHQAEWEINLDDHLTVLAKAFRCYAPSELRATYGLTKTETRKVLSKSFNDFTCDSAYCVAGWAAYYAVPEDAVVRICLVRFADGTWQHINSYAASQLGLTDSEASLLFDGDNRHQYVLELLDAFIERGEKGLAS